MKILGYDINFNKTAPVAVSSSPMTSGRKNPKLISIVENFKDNSRKDIDKWRKALVMAYHPENPKLNFLYDLIDDLKTDGHLQSQIQMRKMSTMNTDFQVINRKSGKINEELSFTLQQQWFYEFLEHALDSILYGTSVVEFVDFNAEKIKIGLIPRRNTAPVKSRIYPDVTKDDFIDYSNPLFAKWLIQLGKSNDLGIINNIIPNIIWKRNVMQSWAEFCEKFGLPLITATTNTSDAGVIDNVNTMLLSLGEAGAATFPMGTDIKFQEANRTDAYQVYMHFMQSNADEISKQLVGSTMLSDQGSNRSQTEVHERTLDDKISQADKRNIGFIVNDILFPLLQEQGYSISPEDYFEFKTAEQENDLTELWNITSGLINNGYEVEQDWISKTFNIPLGAKKKIPANNPQPKVNTAAAYLDIETKERYPFACSCGKHAVAVAEPLKFALTALTKEMIKAIFYKEETAGIYGNLIVTEALYLVAGLRDNFETFSPYVGQDQLMLQMMEYNLFEFSASKTEARFASAMDLLVDEKGTLRGFSAFENAVLAKQEDYNKNWLETEYNLSVATGQNSAAYSRFMAEKDTVTNFVQYQTAGDDKVRPQHQVLDGKVFSLDDKEAMQLWPPNGFGCRCEFLQYVGNTKGKLTTGIDAKNLIYVRDTTYKNSAFEINRGDLKEVFTKKQFYSDNKALPEQLNTMTFDKYGLKKWDDFKDTLQPIKLDSSITSDNKSELFKKQKDTNYMGFEDYLGRKMTMKEKVFNDHTTGKYLKESENRHQLFPHLKNVLSAPDEVWYYENEKGKFQSRYVKFYKDQTLVVDCDLDKNQGLEIKTWYPMKVKDEVLRKGLKIK